MKLSSVGYSIVRFGVPGAFGEVTMAGVGATLIWNLPDVPGVDVPVTDPPSYVLVDNDAQVCRVISSVDLDASYVDNNIDTFRLLDVNSLSLDQIDSEYLSINYTNGATTALQLGSIDFGAPVRTDQYGQSGGIIYPIDSSGKLALNATNTPHLAAMRTWYLNEAKRVNDEHLQIAEIVHKFAEIIDLNAAGG
jgi:hypothetical protein